VYISTAFRAALALCHQVYNEVTVFVQPFSPALLLVRFGSVQFI